MPIVGQFGSLAGLGSLVLPGGAMESIATITVGSGGASSITFSDIPGGFQHLQIRVIARSTSTPGINAQSIFTRFNSDTGSNYTYHALLGDGASATAGALTSQTNAYPLFTATGSATASAFAGGVLDILDYAVTTKNKTMRGLSGVDSNGSGNVAMFSGLWMSTAAVTSINLFPPTNTFAQHSTFALFGLRAP